MKLENLRTKSGQNIAINKVTVLVGPNNSGKSRTLRDILNTMTVEPSLKVVVDSLIFSYKETFEEEISDLNVSNSETNVGYHTIHGIGHTLSDNINAEVHLANLESEFASSTRDRIMIPLLSKFRVAFLDSSTRLNLVQATESYDSTEGHPANILQYLFADRQIEEIFSEGIQYCF